MKLSLFTLVCSFFIISCNADGNGHAEKADFENTHIKKAVKKKETEIPPVETTVTANQENTVDRGIRPPASKKVKEPMKRPSFPPPKAGEMMEIPGGTFKRGSAVGDVLRDQFAENDLISTTMTPFEMDVLPWPNDPALDYLTDITRKEAKELCESVGKRLCTELELEWACKGKENQRYICGNSYYQSAFEGPSGSPSPFGIWAFGTLLELTSSSWGKEPDQAERIAVRGYAPSQEFLGKPVSARQGRRCAKRWRFYPESKNPNMGFRCCKGKINKTSCFIEGPRPPHSLYKTVKPDEFARIIKSIPELQAVHDNPHMFSNSDIRAVLAKRGQDRDELSEDGIHFNWKPLRWIPTQGMELWVAVGRSNRHSFVAVLHEVKDNEEYTHESSMIIWDNPIPLSIAYREGHRSEVYWAPCWRCRDGGRIKYDSETNQVVITSRW